MEGMQADLVTSGWTTLGVIAVALLVAGARNKVVIYYDATDMSISALAIVLPIVAIILSSYQPFVSPIFCWIWKWGILSLGNASGLYCLLINFINAMRHNRSVLLGLFVCVFKIAFLVLSVVVIYLQVVRSKDRKNSIEEIFLAWAIVLCILFLSRALINGSEVYEKNGWQHPQRNRHFWGLFESSLICQKRSWRLSPRKPSS